VPRIYDNIDQHLEPALRAALVEARNADFCVGYFNLRGWHGLGAAVDALAPGEAPCRLLIGMHRPPTEHRRDHVARVDIGETLRATQCRTGIH
jgi:hypothetical protein